MFHTQIQIKGVLDTNWSSWFEGIHVQAVPSGNTLLSGDLPDKSAVYGIISRLSSLGITLISVTCDEVGPAEGSLATQIDDDPAGAK